MSSDPRVRIEGVSHRYGTVTALDDVSLDIADGEFVTLLGPSGCGKTTLLRIVAGFERPSGGRVLLSGEDVTGRPAHRRATNMVFQRPTLFPHLDVFANVAFGLQVAGVGKADQRARVREALELVRLEGYERRRSHQLSGGQMQRIALARALVNRPKVLLLDEPLSALDLKIRLDMEVELRRVHRETGATFVYVTHDQREAMALSDRIAVMNAGRIEQIGAPTDVYRRPASVFAAQFVGDANVLPVEVVEAGDAESTVQLGDCRHQVRCPRPQLGPAWLVLRPEAVEMRAETSESTPGTLRGVVRDVAFRGTGFGCRIELPALGAQVKAEGRGAAPSFAVDDSVGIDWLPESCWLLPRERGDDTAPPPVMTEPETNPAQARV
jgi:spermidine/putrescine ABC transporter ATP-binding subunit